MGVNIKQATYAGPKGQGITGDPPVPSSGKSQPVLDTSSYESYPGVHLVQATYSGYPGDPDKSPPVPNCATIPIGSTDVQNPEATGHDATPPDIFKGSRSNG